MRVWTAIGVLLMAALAGAEPQLIVRLQPGANPRALANKYHVYLRDTTAGAPFALYGVPRYFRLTAVQAQFAADPAVVWAEDNPGLSDPEGQSAIKGTTVPAIGGRSTLYAANTNMLAQINWSSALASSPGRTVKVAILDTGLSLQQGYLWDRVDATENFIEPGFPADDRPRGYDTNRNGKVDQAVGHGTMVAGIVDQIAPQTRLLIARIADSDGNATAWSVVEGLAFAVRNGAEVANVSLGSAAGIPALTDVMDWTEANGLLVVSGVGNAATNRAFYPARISKVASVAGLNPNNSKASFSNWEGGVVAAAPATGIQSQWWDGRMGVWSGTSFASPMVAAAIADALRRRPGPMTPDALIEALQDSGRNIDGVNPSYRRQLGTLLDVQNLNSFIAVGGP